MNSFSFGHLTSKEVVERLVATDARECEIRADVLAHLAEVDARQLYRSAGCHSMYGYCLHHLHLDEEELPARLEAARAARRFPAILDAIADGRLNEEAVSLLAPCLSPDTADELLAAAAGQPFKAIEALVHDRFPDLDRLGRMEAVSPAWDTGLQAAMDAHAADPDMCDFPLPPRWYELKVAVTPETRQRLLQSKAVLGEAVPPGDLAGTLDRVLTAFLEDRA